MHTKFTKCHNGKQEKGNATSEKSNVGNEIF